MNNASHFYRQYRHAQLAERALQLGARLPVLYQNLCLSRRALDDMYRHVVGAPAPKGELPHALTWFLQGVNHLHASLFAHIYQRERAQRLRNLEQFISCYAEYRGAVDAGWVGQLSLCEKHKVVALVRK